MARRSPRPGLSGIVAALFALSTLLVTPSPVAAAKAVSVRGIPIAGGTVTLVGRGFRPGAILQARWDRASSRLRLIWVDSRGRFKSRIRIPAKATPGSHVVRLSRVTRAQVAAYGGTSSTRLIPATTIYKVPVQVAAVGVYGSAIGMDSLNNTEVGGPDRVSTSYRFRASTSAALRSIRVYVIGPTHAGYGGGTGGTWQVSVQTDDGSSRHAPSGAILASTSFRPVDDFPVIAWPSPARLVAGRLYHVVFRNIDPSPTVNYASLDGVFMYRPTIPRQARFSDTDWGQPTRRGTEPWADRPNTVPIMQLNYDNGATAGLGYMEVWVRSPATISGAARVREAFTVRGPNRAVTSVSVRLARVSGSSALAVRLEKSDGTLVERGVIPASSIPLGTRPAWATYSFAKTRLLRSGRSYNLVLSAPSDTGYSIYVIREGASWGFSATTYFSDGRAQLTTGGAWAPFTLHGRAVGEGDLQFHFR